MPSFV